MSNNPYRAMCADMLEAFDGLPCETNYRGQSRPIVCIDEEPFDRARALLAQPEPEGVSADEWDALVGRAWDKYRTVGHQGELFMDDSDFCNALDFVRSELAPWGRPTPQPPADGELTVNLRMDLSSECLKRLCDGLAAAVKPNGGYRALTTDDDISGEFIGEQQVGVEWWLPEHGCDSLENTLDSIKGRLLAAVRDWLPIAVISTPQPPADGEVAALHTKQHPPLWPVRPRR
jgi:hypothetical protein